MIGRGSGFRTVVNTGSTVQRLIWRGKEYVFQPGEVLTCIPNDAYMAVGFRHSWLWDVESKAGQEYLATLPIETESAEEATAPEVVEAAESVIEAEPEPAVTPVRRRKPRKTTKRKKTTKEN